MSIQIFTTGGTIDGLDYGSEDHAPKMHGSLVTKLLSHARITVEYSIEELFAKDSKFIIPKDRDFICQKCVECKKDKIIITHGTAAMALTAKCILQKNIPKTIVLTGAAIPINKENSDALFNLGAALTAVQSLGHGVYITMNGKIFSADNVRKNHAKGIFENER
ncbi:asparaginase [Candidatus Woesearchaeota archaeon]|nr:asparaginase [Candidatus Woesearchaeota archaeon]